MDVVTRAIARWLSFLFGFDITAPARITRRSGELQGSKNFPRNLLRSSTRRVKRNSRTGPGNCAGNVRGFFLRMSVAIILPARLASTRLPNKLLLEAAGKTILEHTIARAQQAMAAAKGFITRIIVAADDPSLIAAAQRAGAQAVLTDPNHTSGTDRIAEAAKELKEDIVVNLQADEPEIDPNCLLLAASMLVSSPDTIKMSTLAVPIFDDAEYRKPNVVKVVVNAGGHAMYFSRAPIPFVREPGDPTSANAWRIDGRRVFGLHHVGLYGYRRKFLLNYKHLPPSPLEQLEKLEQLRALEAGYTIKVGLIQSHPPGIDTPEDYQAFVARRGK